MRSVPGINPTLQVTTGRPLDPVAGTAEEDTREDVSSECEYGDEEGGLFRDSFLHNDYYTDSYYPAFTEDHAYLIVPDGSCDFPG